MPAEQRVTLVLADIEEYSYDQVAEITQTSIGTVKSSLGRGRGALLAFLRVEQGLLPREYCHGLA